MKRPWEVLAAGFVLGEVLALALSFASVFAAALGLAVLFGIRKTRLFRNGKACLILRQRFGFRLPVLFLCAHLAGASCFLIGEMPRAGEKELDRILSDGGAYRDITLRIEGMETGKNALVLKSGTLLVTVPTGDGSSEDGKKADGFSPEDMPAIGNTVRVSGKLSRMEHASNPGQFDFADFYRAQGITHRFYADGIFISSRRKDVIPQKIFELRNRWAMTFQSVCEADDAGFLRAALLGDRSGMDEDVYELYRKNGIAHLLAISGLHMAIIGLGLYRLLRKCGAGFVPAGITSGIFLVFYGVLTGSGTSIRRSVIMLLVFFLAQMIGRTSDLLNTVCLSAVIILFFSPRELFQCGFQLSFLAVIAIAGPAKQIIRRFRIRNSLLQSLAVSGSVSLLSLPVVAYWFYSVPVFGIFLNLIVIPLMTYVVWSGLALLFLFPLSYPAALASAGITHRVLEFYLFLCRAIQKFPFHRILTGRPELFQIVLFYLFFFLFLHLLLMPKRLKTAALTGVLCLLSVLHIPAFGTEISFLDVGQGDSIAIQKGFSCILIDSGSSSNEKAGEYILKPFLESNAVGTIREVFLTHADSDHTNAVEYLLESGDIGIENVILPALSKADEKYDRLKREAEQAGSRILYMGTGDAIRNPVGEGSGILTCLSPEKDLVTEETNEESLVFLYEAGNFSCLFTGDTGKESENRILERAERDDRLKKRLSEISVLKVAHHGSKNSSGAEFLKLLRPEIAVLSYGIGNRYGHPSGETVGKLTALHSGIYSTAEKGCITVRPDGDTVIVETCRGKKRY